ncbi:hypothetical protein AT2G17442 [Arabidopsis thaliana]|uniref:Uncharacterized protein n=1 Tax=Arabidopsis thaliana TaxID=3702 RepID=B3H517_ARATH|nr:uncharacterized protein AT2G17442 [Arabidopsis thaliana]NP_001324255.1 uncharacterized protein AT2G17442 [Arabidopsis thaliana]AEC06630.1 hypothetical protein AT2G17442 [Arabidopsis thaliana]ANM62074.1 hypothetical protein AT2G17442 [Arabidopsis thaliana]|eukprot:NP_001118338.1 hypothetical protein AT2G17442 [Arabidopsis thaliana]
MKKGLFGRAFANSPIFALGYFTRYSYRLLTFQALAEAESIIKTYEAKLAEVEKMKKMAKQMVQSCEALMFKLEKKEKMLDDLGKLFRAPRMDVLKGKEKKLDYLGQLYSAPRMDLLKEIKNADGRYAGRN